MLRGDRLRAMRHRKGYTHEQLAEQLGLNAKQIWRYESGKTDPSGAVVTRIARLFEVSSDFLLGLTDEPVAAMLENNLSDEERSVITAMRQGDRLAATRLIVAES